MFEGSARSDPASRFPALAAAISAVPTRPDRGGTAAACASDTRALLELTRALQSRLHAQLACPDEQGFAAGLGFASTTAWVAAYANLDRSQARRVVLAARTADRLPLLGARHSSGKIGAEHLVAVAAGAPRVPDEVLAESDKTFADFSGSARPGELRLVAQRLQASYDHTAVTEDADHLHESRRLSLSRSFGDAWLLDGQLEPVDGAALDVALQSLMAPRDPEDKRTIIQRRADALIELVHLALAGGQLPDTGGDRPRLTFLVTTPHHAAAGHNTSCHDGTCRGDAGHDGGGDGGRDGGSYGTSGHDTGGYGIGGHDTGGHDTGGYGTGGYGTGGQGGGGSIDIGCTHGERGPGAQDPETWSDEELPAGGCHAHCGDRAPTSDPWLTPRTTHHPSRDPDEADEGERADGEAADGERDDGEAADGERDDGERDDGQRNLIGLDGAPGDGAPGDACSDNCAADIGAPIPPGWLLVPDRGLFDGTLSGGALLPSSVRVTGPELGAARSAPPLLQVDQGMLAVAGFGDGITDTSTQLVGVHSLLPATTIARIGCNAEINTANRDIAGDVLSYGRSRRRQSRSQARAVVLRDGHCVFPGCEVPASRCIFHHLEFWDHGGPTNIDHLALVCLFHHHRVHEHRWWLQRHQDHRHAPITWIATAPDGHQLRRSRLPAA